MILKTLLLTFALILKLVESENEVTGVCSAKDDFKKPICDCVNESSPPWGLWVLKIDCSYRELSSRHFDMEVLPLNTIILDIAWNRLEYVPSFASESARELIASHNNVSAINEKNFENLPNLKVLDLSWNAIQIISINAFAGLKVLTDLNLSHNNVKKLHVNIFSHLVSLQSLSLSWNRQLNNSDSITELDMYSSYGLPTKLKTLELEKCNLSNIDLRPGLGLERLNLRGNQFEEIPTLAVSLKYLDFSDNPMASITPKNALSNFTKLNYLLLEDMQKLSSIEQGDLGGLPKIKSISFQNSRKLNSFDPYALGSPDSKHTLEMMNFRGTIIKTFNSTLQPIFSKLKYLNLNGMILTCNCDLLWMKSLDVETNGQCFKPVRLRGFKISQVRAGDYGCDNWPRWVYGILIMCLIALCAGGIWLLVMGLRPYRRVQMRDSRVGANSPYARVTIEPSRAENDYY